MSIEANKGLVRRHIDLLWNRAEFDALDEIWSPDAVVHVWDLSRADSVELSRSGLASVKDLLRRLVSGLTDRVCEIETVVAEGDTVAVRWVLRGTDPSSEERWTVTGMDFYRLSAGRIVEDWMTWPRRSQTTRAWPVTVEIAARDEDLVTAFPLPDLEALASFLSDAGYEAELHRSEFGVGVDPVGVSTDILLWVRDHLAADAAIALATLVARWFRKRKPVAPHTIKVLYSANGDVLAEVEVPN